MGKLEIEIKPRDVHAAQSKAQFDDCDSCAYCGIMFGNIHHEHDHAPVPKSAGGNKLLPACLACHDLKDRFTVDKWHSGTMASTVIELLALGRMNDFREPGSLFSGALPTELPAEWDSMSRFAKIMWAKMARLAYSEPESIPDLSV